MRFTIDEYAKAYSISAEMVHSRLRRNRLNYIIEDETTYIVVPKHQVPSGVEENIERKSAFHLEKKTTVATVIGLYQKENHYLKVKIDKLEAKIDKLIQDKETLLKEERERIEKVYTNKDAQLKSILELVNTKLLQDAKMQEKSFVIEEKTSFHKTESLEKKPMGAVELKQYLRSIHLKSAERKSIKRRFAEAFGSDSRVLLKNGLFYLDFSRYDYSDLLKLK